MTLKQRQNIFHVIVKANLIVQHVIQIKNGIMKHVNMSVKIIVHAKKIIVEIQFYFAHSFISDHITIDNYYYLLSLYKTKNY